MGLNSTLHPIGESGGGGLNLMLFQLVDWIFCGQRECMGEAGRRKGEGGGGEGEGRKMGKSRGTHFSHQVHGCVEYK